MNVLLVDDHKIVVKGLKLFLGHKPDIKIVGEASNGVEAIEKVRALSPDLVLMDLMMPGMDGVEATKRIKEVSPHTIVVVLTSYSDQDHVIPAIQAGASGYQLKEVDPEELVMTLRAAGRGETYLHPSVTNHVLKQVSRPVPTNLYQLTKREKEVLFEITQGKSNKQISADLYITEKTVKTHVSNILSKLDLHDRTQAAIYAMKQDLFKSGI